jgi:hypothetical protein
MTRAVYVSIVVLVSIVTTSCVTLVDGSWVSGRIHDVTRDDVRAAVAAARVIRESTFREQGMGSWAFGHGARQVDVIGPDEIHIYWTEPKAVDPSHMIVQRIHGKWRYAGETIATE